MPAIWIAIFIAGSDTAALPTGSLTLFWTSLPLQPQYLLKCLLLTPPEVLFGFKAAVEAQRTHSKHRDTPLDPVPAGYSLGEESYSPRDDATVAGVVAQ